VIDLCAPKNGYRAGDRYKAQHSKDDLTSRPFQLESKAVKLDRGFALPKECDHDEGSDKSRRKTDNSGCAPLDG
jgi:hypothetical protein